MGIRERIGRVSRHYLDHAGDFQTVLYTPDMVRQIYSVGVFVWGMSTLVFVAFSRWPWELLVLLVPADGLLIVLCGLAVQRLLTRKNPTPKVLPPVAPKMPTLEELAQSDFKHCLGYQTAVALCLPGGSPDRPDVTLTVHTWADLTAQVMFCSIFIPATHLEFPDVIRHLALEVVPKSLEHTHSNVHVMDPEIVAQGRSSADFKFCGMVYVYTQGMLSSRQVADLQDFFQSQSMTLTIRGFDYVSRVFDRMLLQARVSAERGNADVS